MHILKNEMYFFLNFGSEMLKKKMQGMVLTSCNARGVLSPCGRCSSNANTMQLAMMVSRTIYSNGVNNVKEKETGSFLFFF